MSLTQKIEKEVLDVYDTWMHSYLHGDVEAYDSFLDDDYHFIGSAKNEEFLNRKDTTKFFEDTGDQFAGKTEIRDETKTIEQFGELIFITHIFDGWFLNENDWTYYARFRFTSVLKNTQDGWRFIYQHFSIPDSKTEEGETIGYDKINDENQELREAITRRTFELEAKNRELEIEGALDRIRAQAVAMRTSSDLLDIVVTMRTEFIKLGHEAHYFWHMMWLPETYEKAMTSGDGTKIGFVMQLPRHIHGDIPLLAQWEKSKKPTVIFAMNTEEALDYVAKMVSLGDFQNIDPQAPSEDDIRHIGGLTFIMARTTHGEIGYSLPGVVENPPMEDLEILEKFAGAFDLAHRRFLDLQKAEKQAREVQIELALEKVRSRTMAMQNGEEIKDVVVLLYKELITLGVSNFVTCGYVEINEATQRQLTWVTSPGGDSLGLFYLPLTGDATFDERYSAWKKQQTVFHQTVAGKARKDHLDYAITTFNSKEAEAMVLSQFPDPTVFYCFNFSHGYLHLVGGSLLMKEEEVLLARFTKVFEQTYARFLDLQKAENQAREAQIEAALERVRSRSMAMQKSEELKEVIQTVYNQFINLNINIEHTGFIIDYKENDDMHIWLADKNEVATQLVLPYFDCAHWNSFKHAKIKKEKFFTNLLSFEEKNKFYKDLFALAPELPDSLLKIYLEYTGLAISTVLLENVGLYIENFDGIPYSEEENAILMRFGKVFQQTYTRFLDLQKAEAQAKEAKIEAALERIRSQSMGMQTADDLSKVTTEMFNQLRQFGGELFATGIVFCNKHKNHVEQWHSIPNAGMMSPFIVPIDLDYIHQYRYDQWEKGTELFSIEIPSDFIEQHFNDIFNLPSAQKVLKDLKDKNTPMPEAPPWEIDYGASFKYGYVLISSLEHFKEAEILPRFAKVFEQTYTRFLDLQKAEAQTREAQIEMALEKVRSRTMAMQHSEELPEAANVLFTEVQNLGIPAWSCGYNILSKDKKSSKCIMSSQGEIQSPFMLPLTEHKSLKPWHKAILNNEDFFVYEQGGKDLEEHYAYMQSLPELRETFLQFQEADIPLPTFQVNHLAKFTNGFLLFITYERVLEAHPIFKRFASVFEQTYTRFLDLQKAEAQTREAQINLAVERVRAKALAMHKSEEIMEVVAKLKVEVMELDIPDVISATIFLNEGDDKVRMWDLSSLEKDNNGYEIPFDITFKLKKRDPHLYVKRVWENQEDYFFEKQEEKDFKRIVEWIGENNKPHIAQEIEEFIKTTQLKCLHHAVKKLDNGKLAIDLLQPPTEEMETILTKMGAAFDLAYKRFEDLKKAEAQAKEAKIEASLEKVRSVALSLKNSDDMLDIAQVLYEQLLELGFKDIRNAIIDIHNDETETFLDYDYSHDMSSAITEFSYYGDPVIEQQIKKTLSANDAFFEIELKGEQLEELIETRIRNGEKDDPRLHEIDHLTYNLYSFGNGAIGISNFGILSDAQKKVLKRFRNVFTFAYKRYTDLAKAEEQAREAKIEAALEKVRSVALGLNTSKDMLEVAQALYEQLLNLGFANIRNAIIDIDNDDSLTFSDYDYSHEMGGTVTQMSYKDDPTLKEQLEDIIATTDGFSEMVLEGQQLQDLIEMRRKNGEAEDPRLLATNSLSYILYAFGKGAIGISNFGILTENQKTILSRFRNVFTFAYQRYTDLAQSEAQATALLAEKQRLEVTLSDLQATQSQLIQSEKMASLGELTAGIAHEIQNPLNFVNNFSEVSNELIDEIDEELAKGDMEEVKALLTDIKQNLIKINHHGKRADAIVKGMLQHSRKSTAEKEPTDINKLADEYLRLAYHGLRAKDKSFNATLETDFDEDIGLVKMIPQDIGRVILNLITNAFYATNERKKTSKDSDFKPIVSISTVLVDSPLGVGGERKGKCVEVSVQDNGNGIPKHVIDKIFQPFFTTKPTGEGTGLGLSMSYEIVTKGHGGELNVETTKDEGTTFKILLPTKA